MGINTMTEYDIVEDISASIVREYLSRKGLKGTLQMMDEEFPRRSTSISNRQVLMKELHLEQLMKKNKGRERPYRTMLEVMSKDLLEGGLLESTNPRTNKYPQDNFTGSSSRQRLDQRTNNRSPENITISSSRQRLDQRTNNRSPENITISSSRQRLDQRTNNRSPENITISSSRQRLDERTTNISPENLTFSSSRQRLDERTTNISPENLTGSSSRRRLDERTTNISPENLTGSSSRRRLDERTNNRSPENLTGSSSRRRLDIRTNNSSPENLTFSSSRQRLDERSDNSSPENVTISASRQRYNQLTNNGTTDNLIIAANRKRYDQLERHSSRDKLYNDKQSSSTSIRSAGTQNTTSSKSGSRCDDLIIDDDVESETVLGDGKASLMDRLASQPSNGVNMSTRPRSSAKSRALGMAGPIASNVDESRRKFHKPRAYSAASNFPDWRSDKVDSETENSEPLDNVIKKPKEPALISPSTNINNLNLEKSKKKQLEDLLSADPEKAKAGQHIRKREDKLKNNSGTVIPSETAAPKYDITSSSMSLQSPSAPSKNTTNVLNRKSSRSSLSSASTKVGDLEIGDVDDLEVEISNLDLAPRIQSRPVSKIFEGYPIDLQTAINLKMLIFGSSSMSFNDEWRYQSFTFSDLPQLMYGIVQKKGGPCGVLASIQAVVLQEMFFSQNKPVTNKWNEPCRDERTKCLVRALTRIFWRAGEEKGAVVALEGRNSNFDAGSRFKEDGLTERLTLYSFTSKEKLETFMSDVIRQFELDGHSGVVLALYSAILSRGFDKITNDMDEPSGKLMGAHGYCTQDMVNLLLTGRAVSNVFNDVVELDSGGVGKPMILKGVSGRNDIGLLSLFEHYQSCQVGTYMKTPRYPIWVVCSESHFSVLFSLRKDLVNDWKAERRFDLFYYDGLSKQDEQIKLTIDTTNRYYHPPSDDELVPPLELCIRTKWIDAEVDWNGTEPIL